MFILKSQLVILTERISENLKKRSFPPITPHHLLQKQPSRHCEGIAKYKTDT